MIQELNFYEWKKMLESSKRTEYILFRENAKTLIEFFGEDCSLYCESPEWKSLKTKRRISFMKPHIVTQHFENMLLQSDPFYL